MRHIRQHSAATLAVTFLDDDDDRITPSGTVTAAITDGAGTAITGSPFTATEDGATGTWQITLGTTQTAELDEYDVAWACVTAGGTVRRVDRYEVVGGYLFEIAELRAFDGELSATDYPAADVRAARDSAEERLENLCLISFRRRARRCTLNGSATRVLVLPDMEPLELVSVTIDDVAVTGTDLTDIVLDGSGLAIRPDGARWEPGTRNVGLHYEHGLPAATEPIRHAAMILAREALVSSAIPSRAKSESTDAGTIRFTLAGKDGPTGIPDVDAIIEQFGAPLPAVG